jgi:hypothetical protein
VVDRAPVGDDRVVSIVVIQPKTPVGVGAKGDEDESSEDHDGGQPEGPGE